MDMKMFENPESNELLMELIEKKYKAIGAHVLPAALDTFDNKKDWLIHLIAGQSGLSMAVAGNILSLTKARLIDEERAKMLLHAAGVLDTAILMSIRDSLQGITSSKPAEGEKVH